MARDQITSPFPAMLSRRSHPIWSLSPDGTGAIPLNPSLANQKPQILHPHNDTFMPSEFVDPKALTLSNTGAASRRVAVDLPPHHGFARLNSTMDACSGSHYSAAPTHVYANFEKPGNRRDGATSALKTSKSSALIDHGKALLLSQSDSMPSSSSPVDSTLSSPTVQVQGRRQVTTNHFHTAVTLSESRSSQMGSSRGLQISHTQPLANGIPLITPKEVIPDEFQAVFPYGVFNLVQSKCFNSVYETNDNLVVSAPTGSGKTVLFELAICKLAKDKLNDNAKIVYVAPTKALCREKAEQWKQKFTVAALPVAELTGDTSRVEMKSIREAKIIVTTPEKWDSLTRSWKDHRKLLDLVELFLIDEVHILREARGSTLEAIVSRMKTYGTKIRFIALSATIPNSEDIAIWLGKSHVEQREQAHREVFGEECRPVGLEKIVYGFDCKMGDHPFDSFLNGQLWKHIAKHSERKPLLVFCMTRKSCRDAAEALATEWSQRQPHARLWPEPSQRFPVIDAKLQELVRYGVAFHHAGLGSDDRKAIQQAFEEGNLSVICCTSTLAVGINLPCHTVVLKGTVGYQDGGHLCEYSDLEVMQMLGRAGRPQFGDSAVAIILTRSRNKKRYKALGSGQQVLESTLHKNLIEHLNSEISLRTFQDTEGAIKWLKGTFLSVRLSQNPAHYSDLTQDDDAMLVSGRIPGRSLQRICENAIHELRNTCLITGDPEFEPTEYGRAMSKYMIRLDTMQMILQLPRGANMQAILVALCGASEFNEFRWQNSERELFREINKHPFIMYPIVETIATVAHKVLLLIQVELGHVEMTNVAGFMRQHLRSETTRVLEVMHRLVRTVIECKGSDADGLACCAALELARSMAARAWEGKCMQLLQVPQLGPVLMRKLVASNIKTVADLANTDAVTIERVASRNPPFGKKMLECLSTFPRLTISAMTKHRTLHRDGGPLLHVDVRLGLASARGKWQGKVPIVTFIALTSEGTSVYFWRDSLKIFSDGQNKDCSVHFTWSPHSVGEKLSCQFSCEELVGTVVCTELSHDLSAAAFTSRAQIATKEQPISHASAFQAGLESEIEDADILELVSRTEREQEDHKDHEELWNSFMMMDREGNIKDQNEGPAGPSQHPSSGAGPKPVVKASESAVRLPNGRFKCGHSCSQAGGGKTARGNSCSHDCCRNGSKYPPRSGGVKRKASMANTNNAEAGSEGIKPALGTSHKKRAKQDAGLKSKVGANDSDAGLSSLVREPVMDLDAFSVDEEGLIDLTGIVSDSSDEDDHLLGMLPSKSCGAATSPNKDALNAAGRNITDVDNVLDTSSDSASVQEVRPNTSKAMGKERELESAVTQRYHGSTSYSGVASDMTTTVQSLRRLVEDDINTSRELQRERSFDQVASSDEHEQLQSCTVAARRIDEETIAEDKHDQVLAQKHAAADAMQQSNEDPEPAWVKECDPDLIDEFRDLVDFI